MQQEILWALLLPLISGLTTVIGSIIVFFTKRQSPKFLSFCLGFSAGIMVVLALSDLMPESAEAFINHFGGEHLAALWSVLFLVAGMGLAILFDKMVPGGEHPHHHADLPFEEVPHKHKLMRLGVISVIAIALHNIPEGIATFIASYNNTMLGVSLTFAVIAHNIPEGIALAAPIYYSTGKKSKAFLATLFAGLALPLGALLTWLFLAPVINDFLLGSMYALVAGLMIYISFDELLPAARENGDQGSHLSLYGILTGIVLMALVAFVFHGH